MGVIKDLFNPPKLPKVPTQPTPPVGDTAADVSAQATAMRDAMRAARRRAGLVSLAFGNPATGYTGTPRTASGGLIAT
jgi:hypothetical protein